AAKSAGVKTFLYNQINFEHEPSKDETFFNCSTERVKASWFLWNKNEQLILSFKKKFPEFFSIGKYDLTLAIQKSVYWATIKQGQLHYIVSEKFVNEKIYGIEELYPANKLKNIMRYFLLLNKGERYPGIPNIEVKEGVSIFLENDFQTQLYLDILKKVLYKKEVSVFANDLESVWSRTGFDRNGTDNNVFQSKNGFSFKIPRVNPFRLEGDEWFVFNQIAVDWQVMCNWIGKAEQLVASKAKKVLINEGENGVFGAIFGEVMRKNGLTTYNTMNGIKAGIAQEAFISFDKWFVWDNKMQQLLMEKCKLPNDLFIVSGHLAQDIVSGYVYKNSLKIDREAIKGKTVVSLMSVVGRLDEKSEAFERMYEMASKNADLFLIVRFHPFEKDQDKILPRENPNDNIYFIDNDQAVIKETLYDQLILSDMSIVFGSTVAMECSWFDVPCITFEKRKDSWIYSVDNKTVYHSETWQDVENNIYHLRNMDHESTEVRSNRSSASHIILETLMQNS
ncbi:MAG: hypothetical protein MRY83_07665, partial [Flavobacteriales bacterium]|nr:hypothetical protein [Flavobacteriales bacterium]